MSNTKNVKQNEQSKTKRPSGRVDELLATCCGQQWAVNYCGECGKRLSSLSMHDLVRHCTSTANGLKKKAENAKKDGRDGLAAKRLEKSNKWTFWANGLTKLISS